jgi:hypothetical protein
LITQNYFAEILKTEEKTEIVKTSYKEKYLPTSNLFGFWQELGLRQMTFVKIRLTLFIVKMLWPSFSFF